MKKVGGGIGIEARQTDVDGAQKAVEDFAGFFNGGILAAEENFEVSVRCNGIGNGQRHDGRFTRRYGFGLVRNGSGVEDELIAYEMYEV